MELGPKEVTARVVAETYGRHDPPCLWCGRPIYLASLPESWDGIWSTDPDDEGETISGGWPTECDGSPNDKHDVMPMHFPMQDPPEAAL